MVDRGPVGERVVTVVRVPDCERCRGRLEVASEQRVSMVPPVFDLECRCPACGHRMRVRQVLTHFERGLDPSHGS